MSQKVWFITGASRGLGLARRQGRPRAGAISWSRAARDGQLPAGLPDHPRA